MHELQKSSQQNMFCDNLVHPVVPTCRVELLAQLCHIVVGPRPLPIGEELEHLEALLQSAHAADQDRPLALQSVLPDGKI